jgi:hypothetical protein
VIGLDQSLSMLIVCRRRFVAAELDRVVLINGDMRNFALRQPVSIMTCLYDSLNYLLSERDLARCFQSVHNALTKDGLFIFDMNTIHCLREEWGNNTYHRQDGNINSVWTNQFNCSTNISSLDLTLKIKENGDYATVHEFHQERGYPLHTVGRLLSDAGFTFSLYRHLTFNPAHEQDIRIMGVAQPC